MTAIPVWQRIAQTLGAEVEGASPGMKLATEAELSTRFGVNRHTVRRALESLTRRGLVRVERGRGAFVAEAMLDYAVTSRTRFSEWVRRHDKIPLGRVLRICELPAPEPVAEALGIQPGEAVALLERLGLADNEPISLAEHYFPVSRLPGIVAALTETPGVTEALARAGVSDYVRRSTRVAARLPSRLEADLLHMPLTQPLLVCENVNADLAGTVVEFGIARHPSTRVQVVFEP